MKQFPLLQTLLPFLLVASLLSGCVDNSMAPEFGSNAYPGDERVVEAAPTSEAHPKLRFPHLLEKAMSRTAGKDGATVHLYLAFSEYEADGVTRRVLDSYGITRRIMEEYGVTRRVLDNYGITRRILEDYGVTRRVLDSYGITRRVLENYGVTRRVLEDYSVITDALLAQWGVTWSQLESQGVTRRVLDDYGLTRRVLDDYNVTLTQYEEALAAFDSVIRVRLRVSKTRPGISISFGNEYLDAILEELYTDPDVDMIDPDYQMEEGQFDIRRGMKKSNEMIPWSLGRIGGIFTRFSNEKVHVYVLDSGVFDRDLKLEEKKDFTMLFQNRDQEFMDEEEIVQLDVFDPGVTGDWSDQSGHGSHVAGIIGAEQNDRGIRGVARGVKLHSLKVLTAEGKTDLTTVMAAVDYVTDQKQRNPLRPMVMNLSLGMDIGSGAYNALDEAIQRAIDNGVVVVVSAGNDGTDAATYSPAHVREAITVGAYNEDNRFASYSNYGPVVDILAPGTDIPSLTHLQSEASQDENILMSGTSHAAPHVTGAAALYLALNNLASPAEVKQALINNGRTDIEGVPMGTTDRTVHVAGFAGDGQERSFKVTKAEWKDGVRIVFEGEGERLARVGIFNPIFGSQMATFDINESGTWSGSVATDGKPPCEVTSRWSNQSILSTVVNAPLACLKPLAIKKAVWDKKKGMNAKGTGLPGRTVVLHDHASGQVLASSTIDTYGSWEFDGLSAKACAVRISDGEGQVSLAVEGMSGCSNTGGDGTSRFSIVKASYGITETGGTQYKIKGTAPAGERIALFNAINGFKLGELDADYKHEFTASFDNPTSVPCEVRAEMVRTGESATSAVEGAPFDCVGGFRLAEVRWDAASKWLHVTAVGAPYGDLELQNGRNGAAFNQSQFGADGLFQKAFRNMVFIPCSVTAVSGAETATLPVANAPANCDVNTVMNVLQWSDAQWFLSLGGTATPGLPVTLYNADTDAEIAKTAADRAGNWRLDLNLSETPVPPCNISVRAANGDVINRAILAGMCNTDFVYRAPGSTWEQNPYSFIEITKAEYKGGKLVLEGDGYVFMRVDLTSTATGNFVGTAVVNDREEWAITVPNLSPVPCSVTATLDGRTFTKEVKNAPSSCDAG